MRGAKVDAAVLYEAIAKNLREHGYPDCTAQMIRETHEAIQKGEETPHSTIGAMAKVQLQLVQSQGKIV